MAQTPWFMGSARRCEPMGLRSSARSAPTSVADGFEIVDDVQVLEVLGTRSTRAPKMTTRCCELAPGRRRRAGHGDRGAAQRFGYAGRIAAVVLRCVSDGFVGANGITPDAMNVDAIRGRATDGDTEADVSTADICYQASTAERSNCFALGSAPGSAVFDCHHLTPKTAKTCARADNAVNQLGPDSNQ